MDEQKILTLASQLVVAGITNNEEEINLIASQLAAALQQKNEEHAQSVSDNDYGFFLKFSSEEILKMPKKFKKEFRAQGSTVHITVRLSGKSNRNYVIRYRRHGYDVYASSNNLDEAKRKFIERLNEADKCGGKVKSEYPTTFNEFALYFFEKFWKRKVTTKTYSGEMNRYKNHIQPYFASAPLKKITPSSCQTLIDNLTSRGIGKTADEVYSTLNKIFKAAIKHHIIELNPLDMVVHFQHAKVSGVVLTKEEEEKLIAESAGTAYQLMFAVALYTGMRPNEYKTARIEGEFIISVNSKQKDGKVHYKRIPITPMLKPYLEGVTELKFYNLNDMRIRFKKILPNHSLKDMRKTFNTRCHECKVDDVARKEFMGHSLGTLDNTYTYLSDEFLLAEGSKIKY
jgi:integrase